MSLKTFVGEALTDFSTVAAITPSSKFLAMAMMKPLELEKAHVVLELGAGTGVITQALLDHLPPTASLLVFEINRPIYECLRQRITDPRAILINTSVENLEQELRQRGITRVDAVASSLGLAFMPESKRDELLQHLSPFLHEGSVFTQYQYIHGMQFVHGRLQRLNLRPLLHRYFRSVKSHIVWRNLPPAFVFSCHVGRSQAIA